MPNGKSKIENGKSTETETAKRGKKSKIKASGPVVGGLQGFTNSFKIGATEYPSPFKAPARDTLTLSGFSKEDTDTYWQMMVRGCAMEQIRIVKSDNDTFIPFRGKSTNALEMPVALVVRILNQIAELAWTKKGAVELPDKYQTIANKMIAAGTVVAGPVKVLDKDGSETDMSGFHVKK